MTRHDVLPVSLAALGHFMLEVSSNFLPVVYPLLIAAMGLTYSQVGLVALVLGIGTSATQPVFGYWSDRWSPWKMAALGVAWTGGVLGTVGLLPAYWLVLLVVATGALGSAAFHPSGATIAYTGGGRRRGAAVSIFSVGGNLGAAVSPLLVSVAVGWLGLTGTTVLIPLALAAGLVMYWRLGTDDRRRDIPSATSSPSQPIAAGAANGWLAGLVLIVVAIMARSWFQVTLMTYLPTWIQTQGHPVTTGGQLLFAFSVAVGAGSLTGGTLSDYVGRWRVLAIGLGLLGPAYWAYLNAASLLQMAALLAVMGMLIGLTFPVSIVLAQELWPRGVGLASALVMGLGWAPGGIGASVTGLLADRLTLEDALQWLIVAPLVGLVAIVLFAVLRQRVMAPEPT